MSPFEDDRDDIVSGNVWPDRGDPAYVEWLERRVDELETGLARAQTLLEQREAHGTEALRTLDEVVAQLEAEEHAPPPRHRHPSSSYKRHDDAS
jgi:hypothetical protein